MPKIGHHRFKGAKTQFIALRSGIQAEILLHSSDPQGVFHNVTLQYSDAACDQQRLRLSISSPIPERVQIYA